jgi:hypothetical protein
VKKLVEAIFFVLIAVRWYPSKIMVSGYHLRVELNESSVVTCKGNMVNR